MEPILIKLLLLIPLAYLLGSIPSGYVLVRIFAGGDVREKGSKNIGATNVTRVAGPMLGLLTLGGDFFKGVFPVYLAVLIARPFSVPTEIFVSLVAFFSFMGHLYPVFTGFRGGGKGVATTAGCFFILAPVACGVSFLIFVILVFVFKRVSVASMGGAAILPFSVWITSGEAVISICALVMSVLIVIRHRDNVKRLLLNQEPVIWKKK